MGTSVSAFEKLSKVTWPVSNGRLCDTSKILLTYVTPRRRKGEHGVSDHIFHRQRHIPLVM
jgi:hypothetical protein